MSPTVYLVSGANRGLGLGLVTHLAARDNVVVFAGTRNPSVATDLQALSTKYPSKVHIVKLVASDKAGNEAAIAEVTRVAGRLDVVIANAGIATYWGPILGESQESLREHYDVNLIGTVVLFQAAWPLLKESAKPTFVLISAVGGSVAIGGTLGGFLGYGASKAALNYLAMKLHSEHPSLVVLDLNPGATETDMGLFAKKEHEVIASSFDFITVEQSVTSMLKLLDDATRVEEGPKLTSFDGTVYP